MKSTDITKEKNVNIIPLKRPVSAYGIREIKNNDRNINNNRVRALTPPSQLYNKKTSHKNNYISEYNAKYRNYSNVLSISQNQSKLTDKKFQYDWYQEILKLREKADEYRKRDRESHFSREHLAQLDSNSVGYWDPSSTESYAENIEKYKEVLQMPRAGKPSTDLVLDPYNEPPVSQRMKAMFDSQNIAKIMDQDDCSDTDIDQDPEYNCKQSFTCPHSEYTSNIKHIGDTYAGMLPNTKQRFQSDASHYKTDNDLHEITNLEDNNRINNPHIEEWENYPNNHRIRNQNQWDQNSYKKNQRSLDETESITSCSSLSEKSMELSSRLAYETLERAQKQHERVLREKQQYDESKYTSNAYSDYKSIQ
ncbi:unnamed protein product [Heterobilharzia americana]|nr:unnamed protein product [Heterobilharzia americana]